MSVTTVWHSREAALIRAHYGGRCAERSQVPLMNHIVEGVAVLAELWADQVAMRAFMLHPLLQEDSALQANWEIVAREAPADSVLIAMEYRHVANAYLSTRNIEATADIKLGPIEHVNCMLIADKVQNYKDFLLHHVVTHPRAAILDTYFKNWFARMSVDEKAVGGLFRIAAAATHTRIPEGW